MHPQIALPIIAAIAFAMSLAITRFLISHSSGMGLVQIPNHRSSHAKPTPSGGGVSIVMAGTLATVLMGPSLPTALPVTLVIVSVAGGVMGLLDDRLDIPARYRLVVQFLLVGILLVAARPNTFDLSGLDWLAIALGLTAVLAGVWWVNLFNFMDGIDGIAATEAIFILGGAILFLGVDRQGAFTQLSIAAVTVASIVGFLIFNWPPARIFMGDAGSNYLAYLLLGLAVTTVAAGLLPLSLWMILPALFVADASVTLFRRALRGERLFSAHKVHAYQKLSRRLNGHLPATLLYAAINVFWLFPAAVLSVHYSTFEWLIAGLSTLPLVVFCWLAGAGQPDAPENK